MSSRTACMFCFTRVVDHARAGDVVAVLRGVGDRPALLGDAALVHQVDDQLQLVEALEVGDLGLVAGLGEHLEAVLHQLADAPPQRTACSPNRSVSVSSVKVVLMPPARRPPMRLGVGQREVPGRAGRVLLDGDEDGYAAPVDVLATDEVARALRARP